MLFNSYEFILVFLPVVFAGTFLLGSRDPRLAAVWLGSASLVFYGMWDSRFIFLLLLSVAFNYGAGVVIARQRALGQIIGSRMALVGAVSVDLAILGYYKYANFFRASVSAMLGESGPALDIVLPLGISFFTFTQIAFLVDAYRGTAREYRFIHYLMFVTYFPHLIAGPLFHHGQMMPQFERASNYRVDLANVGAGLTIFILGLVKKVLIADGLAEYATLVFDAAQDGKPLMVAEAWIGALAYTLQLYFDFSAYSDMAIGLALMLCMRLPLNFDSPYKATSIIDFWRRWHMTLSAFLRDYLYIPLGGNRKGKLRRYANVFVTMLLGGLWHGAGWTFVVWGGLHGLYLIVNHGWRELKQLLGWGPAGRIGRWAAGALTFLAVVVGWVVFRAESMDAAWGMLWAMMGGNGISLPGGMESRMAQAVASVELKIVFEGLAPVTLISPNRAIFGIAFGLIVCWYFPNVRQLMSRFKPVWEDIAGRRTPSDLDGSRVRAGWHWQLTPARAAMAGALLFLGLLLISSRQSEFLYFQF
jgi:D-alanyl-lipoteichoic acid acyltransferase DltB (MBOAT superfamily)